MAISQSNNCGNQVSGRGEIEMAGNGTAPARAGRARMKILLTLVAALGALMLAGNAFAGGPTITSDKADYEPGSPVTLTGIGWGVGESVHVTVDDSLGQSWSWATSPDPLAGLDGSFTVNLTLPNMFIASYTVNAVGSSGATATYSFTDGNAASVSGTVFDNANHPVSGATVTCTSGCNNNPAATTTTDASGKYVFDNTTTKLSFNTNGPVTMVLTGSAGGFAGTVTLSGVNNGNTLTGKNITLSTQVCAAAAVTTNPSNSSITYGANATFTAAASGTPAPSVQWQVNTGATWSDISGATSTTLTLTQPSVAQSGNQYRAVFTNSCGGRDCPTNGVSPVA